MTIEEAIKQLEKIEPRGERDRIALKMAIAAMEFVKKMIETRYRRKNNEYRAPFCVDPRGTAGG